MTRPIMLVTGATDGIGRQTALNLARQGARVLVHGRSPGRAETTVEELKSASGNPDLEPVFGDFSSLAQVRSLAQEINSRVEHLDVLVHNAGVYMKTRVLTTDGFETTFQVNHLAPFLLTELLKDKLLKAPSARIVVVSSVAHQGAYLDFQNLQGEKDFDGYSAYALSKLANLLFTFELAERLRNTRVTVNALHPGLIGTKLLNIGFGMQGVSLEQGARTPTFLAISPDVEGVTGRYFADCRRTACSSYVEDLELRRHFWDASEGLVGLFAGSSMP